MNTWLFSFASLIIVLTGGLNIHCHRKGESRNPGLDRVPLPDSLSFQLTATNVRQQAVKISNSGDTIALFSLHFNSLFFEDADDCLQYVLTMPEEYPGEPVERKAWRFVKNHVSYGLTSPKWKTGKHPMILLNSTGSGKCGQQAELLSYIWTKLGFRTKIWSLGGHIVPEVLSKNRWQMYDPSLQVYYLAEDGHICSVRELAENPNLITNPYHPFHTSGDPEGLYLSAIRYSMMMAGIFSSDSNNTSIDPAFGDETEEWDFRIFLPPSAQMEFPVCTDDPAFTIFSFFGYKNAYARIIIPGKWSGEMDVPMVISSIHGNGQVTVDGKEFTIGSEALTTYLQNRHSAKCRLEFDGLQDGAEIICHINAAMSRLKRHNQLDIIGNNISGLHAEIISPDPAPMVSANTPRDTMLIINYLNRKLFIDSIIHNAGPVSGYKDLENKIEILCSLLSPDKDKRTECQAVVRKFQEVRENLPSNFHASVFFRLVDEPPFMMVLYYLVVTLPPDDLARLLSMPGLFKSLPA